MGFDTIEINLDWLSNQLINQPIRFKDFKEFCSADKNYENLADLENVPLFFPHGINIRNNIPKKVEKVHNFVDPPPVG